MSDVTRILSQIESGDQQASEELFPLVYEGLRKLAEARMASERPDHTLQATALVHEAYLRLVDVEQAPNWSGRSHFFSAAAEAMRRILIDHARNSQRLKRGGDAQQLSLDVVELVWKPQYGDILDLHAALEKLEAVDPQSAELVKLRCFAGQTQADTAALMGISRSTADRRWAFARAWLYDALDSECG
jgi:RNA polymerase sigma factor (TIGR02999 family)